MSVWLIILLVSIIIAYLLIRLFIKPVSKHMKINIEDEVRKEIAKDPKKIESFFKTRYLILKRLSEIDGIRFTEVEVRHEWTVVRFKIGEVNGNITVKEHLGSLEIYYGDYHEKVDYGGVLEPSLNASIDRMTISKH